MPWYKAPATEEKAAPGQQEQPCGAAYLSSLSAACFGRRSDRFPANKLLQLFYLPLPKVNLQAVFQHPRAPAKADRPAAQALDMCSDR